MFQVIDLVNICSVTDATMHISFVVHTEAPMHILMLGPSYLPKM